MASKESMYQLYNPHVGGIWGWDLFCAERALREAREALEHGVGFKSEHAERALDHCLAEAERIRALLVRCRECGGTGCRGRDKYAEQSVSACPSCGGTGRSDTALYNDGEAA